MKGYVSIVFLQGEDYDMAMWEIGAYDADSPGVIYTYAEQWERLHAYLRQWDYGEPGEITERPGAGPSDQTDIRDGYLLTWNSLYGYCGLERIVTIDSDSE